MSIAYLDPGNIESDLQSGAVAGFKVSAKTTEEVLGALWPMWPWALWGRWRDSGGGRAELETRRGRRRGE